VSPTARSARWLRPGPFPSSLLRLLRKEGARERRRTFRRHGEHFLPCHFCKETDRCSRSACCSGTISDSVVPRRLKSDDGRSCENGARTRMAAAAVGAPRVTNRTVIPLTVSTVEALKGVDGWLQGPIRPQCLSAQRSVVINPPLRKLFELFREREAGEVVLRTALGAQERRHRVSARGDGGGMQSSSVVAAGNGEFRRTTRSRSAPASSRAGARSRRARGVSTSPRTVRRKTVTAVHKEPVFRWCAHVRGRMPQGGQDYPDVKLTEVLVDGSR